jgi:uncharacterized membrane protein YozB (DUF420 family)
MNRLIISQNTTLFATLLFIIIFTLIHVNKPSFLYNIDGSIREFGVGYRNKTILPLWLLSIVLGILSYLFILYYVSRPNLGF